VSLRTRLAIAFCAIGLILTGAFLFVTSRQERVLTDQLDAQLESISRNDWRLVDPRKPAGPGASSRVPSGTYVGVLDAAGLRTILESDTGLVPAVERVELTRRATAGTTPPFTVGTVSGSDHMRIVGVNTNLGWVVTGISTAPIASAERQLTIASGAALVAVLAVLTLLMLWVSRLGLRPIRELTKAAEEIAGGSLERRVAVGDHHTEAGRLAIAFNLMVEARQGAEERLRRFVSDASHELRTPLTALRGYTALVANGGLTAPEEVEDALRRIGQEAKRMSVLVDDLLALAS
jgi:two-component system OmpR family sensor kinase